MNTKTRIRTLGYGGIIMGIVFLIPTGIGVLNLKSHHYYVVLSMMIFALVMLVAGTVMVFLGGDE